MRPMNKSMPAAAAPVASDEGSIALARKVLETEAAAILGLVERLDERFERAVAMVAECRGRALVTGMGKSGIVCRKIAATLSSTGTPAFFLHPAEAIHGDLGAIQPDDVVIALSHGGETEELVRLLEYVRRLGARLIAVTGRPASTIGQAADVVLDCHVSEEACPLNLAPTASTTAALALGDALAMAVLVRKGFRADDFANLHPGGRLGKKLLRVEVLMHAGADMPSVVEATPVRDVIYEISSKGLGMTVVVDEHSRVVGVITDGDLRRHMADRTDILSLTAAEVMTRQPVTIAPALLAVEALRALESRKITALVVAGPDRRALGVIHLHDLWRTEFI